MVVLDDRISKCASGTDCIRLCPRMLMRDRVVWQAMGRFRTIVDTRWVVSANMVLDLDLDVYHNLGQHPCRPDKQVIMDYLAVIVNSILGCVNLGMPTGGGQRPDAVARRCHLRTKDVV